MQQPQNKASTKLSWPTREILIQGITASCIFLCAYTAYAKLQDHDRFYRGLAAIAHIGDHALMLSWSVPITELLIALLLIVPRTQRLGLYLFILMMCLFTLYIASMLLWASKLPCNCGGAIEKLSWNQHLWFNLGFIALAMLAIWLKDNRNFKIKNQKK